MTRKSVLLALGLVLLLFGGSSTALLFMVRHEPDFYRRAGLTSGPSRKKHFIKCSNKFSAMLGDITSKPEWGAVFSEEEINSYLQEEAPRRGSPINTLLPDKTSDPRVALEPDRIRVALRYGHGFWSSVISVDLRVWLVAKEPNLLALELERVRAGFLPIGTQALLERITEAARGRDIEVTWYRHGSRPVALLRLQPGQQDPAQQLTQMKIEAGKLTITGADRSRPASTDGQAALHSGDEADKHH